MWPFQSRREIPEGMADLHNHVLFDLDDGAVDEAESVEMLRIFEETGYSAVVATSHLGHSLFPEVRPGKIREKAHRLNELVVEHGLSLSVHPGAEIYYNERLLEQVESESLQLLSDGPHMLIEFSPMDPMPHLKQLAFELGVRGVQPVLAHPERYEVLMERPQLAESWVQAGWTLQLDLYSLLDADGRQVRNTAVELLRKRLYGIAASDMHRANPANQLPDALQALVRYAGLEEATRLTVTNPHRMIEGKSVIDLFD